MRLDDRLHRLILILRIILLLVSIVAVISCSLLIG
mgnify:FL=1